jgi:hypothetical protein
MDRSIWIYRAVHRRPRSTPARAGSGAANGTLQLAGNAALNSQATLFVGAGMVVQAAASNTTVSQLVVDGGSINATTATIASLAAVDLRSGSVAAALVGSAGADEVDVWHGDAFRRQHLHGRNGGERGHVAG